MQMNTLGSSCLQLQVEPGTEAAALILCLTHQILQKQHQESRQHFLTHWSLFAILSSFLHFSTSGNPILFYKTPCPGQCLAFTLIKCQHSACHLKAKIPVWQVQGILVPASKAWRTEGDKSSMTVTRNIGTIRQLYRELLLFETHC